MNIPIRGGSGFVGSRLIELLDTNHRIANIKNDKSKWQAEEVLRKWYDKNPQERNLNILRPAVIFGERNRGNVYNLLKQISSGAFRMVGKGDNKKSMAYVGDIVAPIEFVHPQPDNITFISE